MTGGRRLVQQPLFIGRRDTSGPKELTGPEYWSKWVGARWKWQIASRSYMGTVAYTTIQSISAPLTGNTCQVVYKTELTTNVRTSSFHPPIVIGFTLGLLTTGQEWRRPPDHVYSVPLTARFPTTQWSWTGPSTSGVCSIQTFQTPTATVPSDPTSPTSFVYNDLRAMTFGGGTLPTETGVHVFTNTTTRLETLNPL